MTRLSESRLKAGADEVIDNSSPGSIKELATDGWGPHGVVDFVGAPATSSYAFQVLQGRYVGSRWAIWRKYGSVFIDASAQGC